MSQASIFIIQSEQIVFRSIAELPHEFIGHNLTLHHCTKSLSCNLLGWVGVRCLGYYPGLYRMGHSEPCTTEPDISVRGFRAAGGEVVSGRRQVGSAGLVPALSHCVYMGGDLLRGQPADCVSDRAAGYRRPDLRGVCLGDDELRGGSAFGHSSVATET